MRRTFKDNEKITIVERVLNGADIRKISGPDGEAIHPGVVQNWVRKYQSGEFGAKYMKKGSPINHATQSTAKEAPPMEAESMAALWEFFMSTWKFMFELQAENDSLKARLKIPAKTNATEQMLSRFNQAQSLIEKVARRN